MSAVKRTYSIFKHTLLVTVYAVFFAVQFFVFNVEAFSHTQALQGHPVFSLASRIESAITAKKTGNSTSKTTIRLNKRFQQEEMPPCDIYSIPALVQYTILKGPGYYENVFLPSFFPVSHPLRGPPPVAS